MGRNALAIMSCEEPPKKKKRQEVSIDEILELSSEIFTKSHKQKQKIQKDESASEEESSEMDHKANQCDILKVTQNLLELIKKSDQKKESDFLNLELSYDESQEKVELCEEMLTEARERLAAQEETKKQLEDKLGQKEGELKLLREKLSKKDAELGILKEKFDGIEQNRQSESENSFLLEENQQLKLKNQSLKIALKRELSKKDDSILTLEEEKRKEAEKVESIQEELNRKRQELSSSENKLNKLNILLKGFKDRVVLSDSLEKENERKDQIIQHSEERQKADEEKISTLEDNLKSKEKEHLKLSEDSRKHLEFLDTKLKEFMIAVTQQPQTPGESMSTGIPPQNPMVSKQVDTATTTTTNYGSLTVVKKSTESDTSHPSTTMKGPASSSRLTITPLVQISPASQSASKLLATNSKVHHLVSTNSLLIGENEPLTKSQCLEESLPKSRLLRTVIKNYRNTRN